MGEGMLNLRPELCRPMPRCLPAVALLFGVLVGVGVGHAQTMDVVPDDAGVIKFSGYEGGAFTPETLTTWTIDDLDNAGFEYAVSSDQPWLKVIPLTGQIISVGTDTAKASLVTNEAENLVPGTYTATVSFLNLTNGQGNTTRTVELKVKPSNFTVSPTVVAVEADHGAASPAANTITLTNHGQPALNYSLAWVPASWLRVSKTNGTVPGNGQDTFALSYVTGALPRGAYTADINVVNTTNGRGTTRILVSLVIADPDDGPILTISPIAEGGVIKVQPPGTILTNNDSVVRMQFEDGQIITLTVDVEDGYEFVEWGGDLPFQLDKTSNPITLTMNQARSVTALVVPRMWTLNLSTSGKGTGTIKATPNGNNDGNALVSQYPDGQVVALEATPDAGSVFTGWSGNLPTGKEKANPLTILMDRTRTITARFEQVAEVEVNVTGQGTTNVLPDLETYYRGVSVTLSATPATGWSFKEWTGSVKSQEDTVVVILESDLQVTAVFVAGTPPDDDDDPGNPTPQDMYTLSSEVEGNGVITPASGDFDAGSKLRLVATPAVGWIFTGWEGDASGAELATEIVLDSNRKVIARFQQDPDGDDGGSPTPGAPPMCGAAGSGILSMAMLGLGLLSRGRRCRWPS